MDKNAPNDVNEPEREPQAPPPGSEDAKQFSRWMAEYGRPALIGLAVAVVVLLGISVWRSQKASKAAAAVQALFQSQSPEELQTLAAADAQAPTAPMALATAAAEFYAQNRYDEALEAYQRFSGQYTNHMMSADVAMGVAASLEALERYDEAVASYEAFAAAYPTHALRPQALFGAARCREQLGQFAEARAIYEDFIAANPESPALPQAESGLLFLKKAERAKNAPPPAAKPEAEAVAEAPAATPAEAAPAAAETPAVSAEAVAPAVPAEAVVEPAAAAAPEDKTAQDESKPKKKKRTSGKKKTEEVPAAPAEAAAPAE